MAAPSITRHIVDVCGRDVHYRRRGNGPPVVLLHASPRSSGALVPLMDAAPGEVTVLAFDTPGCGNSAPIARRDAPADADADADADAGAYAEAFAETLSALGIGRTAVYGTHTGAAIAMAFTVRHPDRVTSLVLDGLSLFDADECNRLLGDYLPSYAPVSDGSHLTRLWSRIRDQHLFFPWNDASTRSRLWRPLPGPAQLHVATLDLLRAGDAYRGPYRAAIAYRPADELACLRTPTLIGARAEDVLHPHLRRLPVSSSTVRVETFPSEAGEWSARVWSALLCGECSAPPGPAVDALPRTRIGSAFVGPAGARVHLRGSMGGTGLPQLLLHDSPGSARCFDPRLAGSIGERPVLAADLPGHGDSDPRSPVVTGKETAECLRDALRAAGFDAADVSGLGAGSVVATALSALDPARFRAPPKTVPGPGAVVVPAMPARADGGHLLAAWLHARDEAILGPVWTRDAARPYDFGSAIDIEAVHRHCLAVLVEAPEAAAWRAHMLSGARRDAG